MIVRLFLGILAVLLITDPAYAQRVKDLGAFQGIRTNQLTGYGVVVGLPGTGDDMVLSSRCQPISVLMALRPKKSERRSSA